MIKYLPPIIGGGFFINAGSGIIYRGFYGSISPIWLQLVATSLGMVLGYCVSTKALKEK